MSEFIDEPARRTPVLDRTQVLVVGGGSAGAAAAIAAARQGADTMLLERYGALGGLATGGLIILLLTLDDGDGRQVIGGLCQEAVDRLVRRGGAFHPPRGEWGASDTAQIERDRRWGLVWGSRAAPGALLGRLRPGGAPFRVERDGRVERCPPAPARVGVRAGDRGSAGRRGDRAEQIGPRRHPGRRRHRRHR